MANITLKEKVGYGLGDAASSMFWKLFSMYLLFFYTDIFGIPAAIVGTMFLITRVWDSLIDPLIGVISDRTESKYGKFRPYILYGAIPFGIVGVFTFTTPDFSETGKIVYAYITYTLMMMVYSFVNVPYASLLGVMSGKSKDRTELSSYRMIFAFGGSIFVLLLIEPLVNFFSKMSERINLQLGWQMALVVIAGIVVLFFMATFSWTKERVKPIKETKNTIKEDVKDLLRNRPWWILLGASIGALIFNSIRDGAAVYYFKYYVQNESHVFNLGFLDTSLSLTTLFLVLGQAANIVGIICVTPIANNIGKKNTFFMTMTCAFVLSIAFYFIGKESITIILVMQFLISMCAGSVFPLMWSMYADTADYSELKTGRRATGLVFSASSMSQKLGWTLGGALTGWLLGMYGFKANIEQTAEAQNGIRLMLSFFPAIGAVISVVFISLYPLSAVMVKEVEKKLKSIHDVSTKCN